MQLAINTLHEQLSAMESALFKQNKAALKLCAAPTSDAAAIKFFIASLPAHKMLAEVRKSVRALEEALSPTSSDRDPGSA